MLFEEIRLANGMFKLAPVGVEKPRELTPVEKIALDKKNDSLREKAETRQELCWLCQKKKAYIWVSEVGFDFKGEKADPVKHVAITTADYNGPVPGFCHFCLGHGPARLAEAVYFNRPEMYWGVRPTRWFVSFTDGTRQGDMIVTIDPKGTLPKIVEEQISG